MTKNKKNSTSAAEPVRKARLQAMCAGMQVLCLFLQYHGKRLLADLYCNADDLKISGSVDGLSKILYTRGSCDIGQVLHTSSCLIWSTTNLCCCLTVSEGPAVKPGACASKPLSKRSTA